MACVYFCVLFCSPQRYIFLRMAVIRIKPKKCFEIKTRPAVKYMKPFFLKKLAIKKKPSLQLYFNSAMLDEVNKTEIIQ